MSHNQEFSLFKTVGSALAALGGGAFALVCFAVPDLRSRMEESPWWLGWLVAALALITLCTITQWALSQKRKGADAYTQLREAQDTIDAQRQQLASHPDKYDVEQFDVFRAKLPVDRGPVTFLETFDGKRWKDTQVLPLEDAREHWQHWSFKNEAAQTAFTDLHMSLSAFLDWSMDSGFTDDSGMGEGWYTIDYNAGSEKSRDIRTRGLNLASRLGKAIIEFHKVGRTEGLRSA